MPTPGFGFSSYLQVGIESTPGTAVPATIQLELVDWNIAPVTGVARDPSFWGRRSRRAIYQVGRYYKGTFSVRGNYEGLEELLRGATGYYAGTNNNPSPLVNTHAFTEGTTGAFTPNLRSYTLRAVWGNIPAGLCFLGTGCKLVGVSFKAAAGTGNDAMGVFTFDVVMMDMQSGQAITSALSFPSVYPVLFPHGNAATDGTGDNFTTTLRITGVEFSLKTPHAEDRLYIGGGVTPDVALQNDALTATVKLTQEFNSVSQFDAARNFASGAAEVVFQHPTIITGAHHREFGFRVRTGNPVDWSAPITGYGIIKSTATFEGTYDATDLSAFRLYTKNGQAVLT